MASGMPPSSTAWIWVPWQQEGTWGQMEHIVLVAITDIIKLTPYHFMMTSSNENIFRVTGHLCGEFTGLRRIPRTKASDAELWYFLWCARLSKHSRGWSFETLSHQLWRHRNVIKSMQLIWKSGTCNKIDGYPSFKDSQSLDQGARIAVSIMTAMQRVLWEETGWLRCTFPGNQDRFGTENCRC